MSRTLLPLVALGSGLAVTPAAALELGELTVHSTLGQPLRASIAYALAPNEMLSNTCVSVGGGRSSSGLPAIGASTISITQSSIVITGQALIREPMLSTRLTINCRYTPNLSREYMLFVDPAIATPASQTTAPVATAPTVAATAPQPVVRRVVNAPVPTAPISAPTRYQVQSGETLSEIVSRIQDRSVSLWPAVNAIFDANPDAFIGNDPNKLKAGSWLNIPNFDGTAPIAVATVEAAVTPETAVAGSVYEPPVLEVVVATEVVPVATMNELQPGDLIVDTENPYVDPVAVAPASVATVVIPDTQLPGPETTSTTPNVTVATISTTPATESTSLYAWLIGGGLGIFAILVLFGRRIRERFGSAPIAMTASVPSSPTQDQAVTESVAMDMVDIDDDSPTEENLALDADLILGTGLEQGTDMDVAQDFGFAATTELDIELPFETIAPISEDAPDNETDMIPAMRPANVESILESEVLPEDDDYDMSVIVDATKMPLPEDVTERDLQAIAMTADEETLISSNYTISKEVDYDIVEQDYEDEFTATQALNEEIARAAAELTRTHDDSTADDETSALPLASVTELDVTAEMKAHTDATAEMKVQRDPDDTAAVTVSLTMEDQTAEMPVANDDETAEMDVSGGKVDTSKR